MIFHKRLFISNTFDTATILNENKIFFRKKQSFFCNRLVDKT